MRNRGMNRGENAALSVMGSIDKVDWITSPSGSRGAAFSTLVEKID